MNSPFLNEEIYHSVYFQYFKTTNKKFNYLGPTEYSCNELKNLLKFFRSLLVLSPTEENMTRTAKYKQ